jgi:hypothetical protein
MSLWLQSLDTCLYGCGEDLEGRAKCILAHLSMNVPRSWWEQALNTGKITGDYITLLRDLRNELLDIIKLPERTELGLLVALAFADEYVENEEAKYGTFDSQYSVEEYLTEAKKILTKRKDLQILAEKINKKAKLLISNRSAGSSKPSAPDELPVQIEKMDTKQLIKRMSRGKIWNLGNDILYQLCKDHPEHKSPEVITAKIWLIGRAYAAAIERRKTKDEKNDDFYESRVVPAIQASSLDEYLKRISEFSEITPQNIPAILETHKYLTDIFNKISGIEKRSLASKYLHFHFPDLYFLYDSRAVTSSRILLPRFKPEISIQNVDNEYRIFFLKLYHLRELIYEREGRLLSPREIDNILINIQS